MSNLSRIPHAEKITIARSIHGRLADRLSRGPAEPALDAYIDEIKGVAAQLDAHANGKLLADAVRTALIEKLDAADDHVDTSMRHLFGFLDIEARRRTGPYAAAARALRDSAFPSGLDPVDHHIIDENVYCRFAARVLRSPSHQPTITAIGLPLEWIDTFEAAVAASEAAVEELIKARGDRSAHVGVGRDAEATWVDIMVRLRRYVASRGAGADRQAEGRHLLEPLLNALQKIAIDDAARASSRGRALRQKVEAALPDGPPKGPGVP